MAINQDIYGTSEQWFNAYFQQQQITKKNKIAYFGENSKTLSSGVANNKLSYTEPIDNSLSYCGLGSESALSHVAFFGYKDNTRKLLEYNDRITTNFGFFEKTTNTNYTNVISINVNELNRVAWRNDINTSFNNVNDLSPLTVVNPHNIILFAQVEGKADLSHSWTTVGLSDLPRVVERYGWRYFRRVKLTAYFGNVDDNVPFSASAGFSPIPSNYKPFQIGLLDEYNCSEKNARFYMYSGINGSNVVWGFPTDNTIYNDSNLINIAYVPENAKPHLKISSNNDGYIEYYDTMFEDIIKSIACFGLYFTGTQSVAENGDLTNNNMYIGLLDADGVGRGRYLQGAATAQAPQAAASYTDMHNSGYDPSKVDPTKYQNDTTFYAGYGTSSFTKFYALTEAQVNTLSQELYRIANDVPAGTSITEYNMKVFLTNNPIDCVISLKKFPVLDIPLATSDATIYLGSKATSITGKILVTPTWVYYFNFRNSSGTSCRAIFGDNFLDYEPYTKCKIVIPFCGTVDVPVSYIYQYDDLQVALVMDFITGACTAYILVNGITIDSITGSCAIDLPVSGIQSATLDSQIHSVAMAREKQQTALGTGLIAGAVSIGIGLATGNLPVAIGGGAAIIGSFMHATDTGKQINYELSHMDTPVKQVSAASGQITHTYDMRCKMIITRPTIANEYSAEEYAQTIGFACLGNGSVKDFHGFTVANIDISGIDATAEEKEMIKTAFATGVYLPDSWE